MRKGIARGKEMGTFKDCVDGVDVICSSLDVFG